MDWKLQWMKLIKKRFKSDQISKTKFSMSCETKWVKKHTYTIQDFYIMYEPLFNCLEAISCLESHWDAKAVTDAYGLMKRITDPTFIACFQTVNHFVQEQQPLHYAIPAPEDQAPEDQATVLEQAAPRGQHVTLENVECPQENVILSYVFTKSLAINIHCMKKKTRNQGEEV